MSLLSVVYTADECRGDLQDLLLSPALPDAAAQLSRLSGSPAATARRAGGAPFPPEAVAMRRRRAGPGVLPSGPSPT